MSNVMSSILTNFSCHTTELISKPIFFLSPESKQEELSCLVNTFENTLSSNLTETMIFFICGTFNTFLLLCNPFDSSPAVDPLLQTTGPV